MIADIDTKGFSEKRYAYLIKTVTDDEIDDIPAVYLKVYIEGEGLKTLTCREKFRLDGQSGRRDVWGNELAGNPQLIAFKTNSEGLVSEVDTGKFSRAYESEDESLQYGGYYEHIKYKSTAKIFLTVGQYENPSLYISGATKIIKVPSKNDMKKGSYTQDDFEIMPVSYFLDNEYYNMDVFNLSDTMLPEIAVVYANEETDTEANDNALIILVDEARDALDQYGDVAHYIDGYYRTKAVTYSFKNDEIASRFMDENGEMTLKRGDIVRINANDKNQITGISLMRSFSDSIGDKHEIGAGIESTQVFFGMAYVKDQSAVVTRIDGAKSGAGEDMFKVTPLTVQKPIALYDAKSNRISVINMNDILCQKDVGEEKAYLLQVQLGRDGEAKDIIAYKLK